MAHSAAATAESSTSRIIVKWKTHSQRVRTLQLQNADEHSNRQTPLGMHHLRDIDDDLAILELSQPESGKTLQTRLEALTAQPDIEYAAPDLRRFAQLLPNDPNFQGGGNATGQWYLRSTAADASYVSALDAEHAWDIAGVQTNSANVVVAVIDTGVRYEHPDLSAKLLPGYDFVSCDQGNCSSANDGSGWDSDASDPGDWISQSDTNNSVFTNCTVTDSSWHGTRVAGIIGAAANNNTGIAGLGWNVKVLPVRALGKCGGYDSDIIAGMKWAAGLAVSGVPSNPNKATVINLSLGSTGNCTTAYKNVIDTLRQQGIQVVVSAGNEGGPVDAPGNCAGAIAVAGLRNVGTKVGYSSLGPQVSIAAPAGNCINPSGPCLYSIDTTYDTGATVPGGSGYTNRTHYNLGTSFSAPLVSATLALMQAANPGLSIDMARTRLLAAARPFPASVSVNCHIPGNAADLQEDECNCTTQTCGAGMTNTYQAVLNATKSVVAYVAGSNTVGVNRSIGLDASGSSTLNGGTLSYSWVLISGGGALSSTQSAATTFTAPVTSGASTLRLTVTDNVGTSDTRDFTISTYSAPTASIQGPNTVSASGSLSLSNSTNTGADGAPLTYAWTVQSGDATLSASDTASISMRTPNSNQTIVIQLVVKDDLGNTATTTHSVTVSNASKGGGGALPVSTLMALISLVLMISRCAKKWAPSEPI